MGRTSERWSMLLLIIVLLVPTLGVMWFIHAAINSERLASRQRLSDEYRLALLEIQRELDDSWRRIGKDANEAFDPNDPAHTFKRILSAGLCDSVTCEDETGEIRYPDLPAIPVVNVVMNARWEEAEDLEFVKYELDAAATLYREFSAQASTVNERVNASQALVRCLFKQLQLDPGLAVLEDLQSNEQYRSVEDVQGRLIIPNVELLAIEILHEQRSQESSQHRRTRERLTKKLLMRVNDYQQSPMSSSQRLFLMRRLKQIAPASDSLPTVDAEDLALRFLVAHPSPAKSVVLQTSQLPDVWQMASPNGRCVLLYDERSVRRLSESVIQSNLRPESPLIFLASPRETTAADEFIAIDAGPRLPGWRISIAQPSGQVWDAVASRQIRLYLWTGFVVIAATVLVGLLIGRAMRKQIRQTNLKNDLVGTVSHELKTPLAGMRLLVDTLLDSPQLDATQTRQYLQLIANENTRLSRLIDNFLTFSRLERGRHVFQFQQIEASTIIKQAIDSVSERFSESTDSLGWNVEPNLPSIDGDEDALVAALLNLLDNAYKYSPSPRSVAIHAYRKKQQVHIAVSDQGIGLTRSAARRVFQRFYQVDQSLVREGHGCGLGLSIVQTIVHAHHGNVSVKSSPGEGSTFTLELPIFEKVGK